MESFFFNTTDGSYKITELFKRGKEHITRVDISNGLVFFDIYLDSIQDQEFLVKNLDRMVVISVVKEGNFTILDHFNQKKYTSKTDDINIYCSCRQNLGINAQGNIFILFIADFFLKRYLSSNKNEPIDFLYHKIQDELSLELVNTHPLDALSLYLIDKILQVKHSNKMNSIICEHSVIEFMIYRLSLLDISNDSIDSEELQIALKAKQHILKSFINPPTIRILAHLCATNESKLKKVFKKVHKTTIYAYIQKLRLEEANLLLKEQILNIGEIAKEVGYKHQGHFSKLFFKTYGVYPKNLLQK